MRDESPLREVRQQSVSSSARSHGSVLPLASEVQIELDELDRAIRRQLADDREHRDERSSGDEDPIVRASWDELQKSVEPTRETIDDPQQLEHLEVVTDGSPLAPR